MRQEEERRKREQELADLNAANILAEQIRTEQYGPQTYQNYTGADATGVIPSPLSAVQAPAGLPDYRPNIPAATFGLSAPQQNVGPSVPNVQQQLDPNIMLAGKSYPYEPWMDGIRAGPLSTILDRMKPDVPKLTEQTMPVTVENYGGQPITTPMTTDELNRVVASGDYSVSTTATGGVRLIERQPAPKEESAASLRAKDSAYQAKLKATVLGDVGQGTVQQRERYTTDKKGKRVSAGFMEVPSVEGGALMPGSATRYLSTPADISNAQLSALTDTLAARAASMGADPAELYSKNIPVDARQNALLDVLNLQPTIADPSMLNAVAALDPGWVFDNRGTETPLDDKFVNKVPGGLFNDKRKTVKEFLNSPHVRMRADAEGTIEFKALSKLFKEQYGVDLVNLIKSENGGIDESLGAIVGKK
jgi:hypothetical protein